MRGDCPRGMLQKLNWKVYASELPLISLMELNVVLLGMLQYRQEFGTIWQRGTALSDTIYFFNFIQ